MKRKKVMSILLIIGMMSGLCGCGDYQSKQITVPPSDDEEEQETQEEPDTENKADFSSGYMDFAFELFGSCAQKDENVMVSPVSVSVALTMAANGAQGETLSQMEEVLFGYEDLEDINKKLSGLSDTLGQYEDVSWKMANSLWFREQEVIQLQDDYVRNMQKWYDGELYRAPFDSTTVRDINHWVDEHTDGMIDEIIDEIPAETIMYLLNAVTFDAEWEEVYTKEAVWDDTFTMEEGRTQEMSMMNGTEMRYLADENTTGFIKPYKEGYSFVALLPQEGMSLADYEAQLDAEKWQGLMESVSEERVYTRIPQFSTEYEAELNDVLVDMGMEDAFDEEDADFSNMLLADDTIRIGKVVHKTYIEVDELGTKAGAVTSVSMDANSAMPEEEPKRVYLNRPFVYVIIEDSTGLPVFIGEFEKVTVQP